MSEEIDRGSSERQATWVALRTMRQRPTVVGRTDEGFTVYEIRSVRLVLTPGSAHFRRLVPCAKCGRDVPGSSVLSPVDLDRPANPVFCDRCAQSSGLPRPEIHRETEDPPAQVPPRAAPPVARGEPSREPEPDHGRRLATVEAQLAKVMSKRPSPVDAGDLRRLSEQAADVLRGQNAELAKVSASVAEVRAEMRELGESNRALARVQGDLDQRMAELTADVEAHPGADIETALARELVDVRASLAAMIDAMAQPLHAALAEGLDHLRSEIAALHKRIDDESAARSEMRELAESDRALAQVQGDLDQKVSELAAQLAALPGADPEVARELAEVRASMADTIGTEDTQLRVELAEGLELLRAEIGSLEHRSRDEFAAVAALLEAQRKELADALHDVAHETLMSVAEPLRDLTKAREEFERRLETLQQKAQEDQRRMEALNASANAGASRLHALEQKLQSSVQRLIHAPGAEPEEREVGPAPRVDRRPPGALLESVERQLREAEERLGQL